MKKFEDREFQVWAEQCAPDVIAANQWYVWMSTISGVRSIVAVLGTGSRAKEEAEQIVDRVVEAYACGMYVGLRGG